MKDPQSKHALVGNCMVLKCLYVNLPFLFCPTECKHVRRQHAHSAWIMDLHILFFSVWAWGSNKKLRSTVFHSTSTQHSQYSKLVISMPMMMRATSSVSSRLASLQDCAHLFWGIVAFHVASGRTEYASQWVLHQISKWCLKAWHTKKSVILQQNILKP